MASIAFIGLGVMGYRMAGHIAGAGHTVVVFNRTTSKAKSWLEEFGGSMAKTPAMAAKGADIVIACVGNDDDLRAVSIGENGAFKGMDNGAIFVDHTTASASLARELGEIAEKSGLGFLDAPVSGGEKGAKDGTLTIMAGGEKEVFERVRPVISLYARAATLIGPTGSGQLTKMVNQICIAGIIQSLSEGLDFAARAGLETKKVVDVISRGAAQSWQMDNRARTMIDDSFEFGFAVDWMRKDLAICLDEAAKNGAELPITRIIDDYYAEIQAMNGGRWDTSSLIRRFTDQ